MPYLSCPAFDRAVSLSDDLAVEEGVEAVDLGQLLIRPAPLHQHVHVEVDHLTCT